MIRRRRPVREIAFSFDSFLDVVTNVVGIILRLILVAWVGARAYKGSQPTPGPSQPVPVLEEMAEPPEPTDPLTPELERQRLELAQAQAHLLEQLRQREAVKEEEARTAKELSDLTAHRDRLEAERTALERAARERGQAAQAAALSAAELKERIRRVTEEIDALRKAPPAKKTFRYHTPVSQPLQTEELTFECNHGRVALIDMGVLLEDIRRDLRDRMEQLRAQPEVRGETAQAGGFRLHYTLAREPGSGGPGGLGSAMTYSWEVEPLVAQRGESADAALAPGSEFRRIIDHIDPHQTAVTIWVYPDSFPAYRQLRDYMHGRGIEVAGRPLCEGMLITYSNHGTASRGQ
jgi:hypothetical protein